MRGLQLAAEADERVISKGLEAADWLAAAIIFLVAAAVARVLQSIVLRALRRLDVSPPLDRAVARSARNLVVVVGLVYALASLGVRLGPLLGALGIGGLAIAFAAQNILENVFASILLRTRLPIRPGDQFTSGEHSGTLEEISFRAVILRSFEGERVFLPCSQVLQSPIVNHTTTGVRRTSLVVGIDHPAELHLATNLLREAIAAVPEVRSTPPPEVWVTAITESSIDLDLRFWHAPDELSTFRARHTVALAVKATIDEAGIPFPYPQLEITMAAPPDASRRGEPGR